MFCINFIDPRGSWILNGVSFAINTYNYKRWTHIDFGSSIFKSGPEKQLASKDSN